MWIVTLRMYHGTRPTSDVTQVLGIEPTHERAAGWDEEARSTARNGWSLGSEGAIESRKLDDHLSWLIASVGAGWGNLDSLRAAGWDADVDCSGEAGVDGPFRLRAETLAFIGTHGLDLQIRIW
jgi:hypothetical protein